MQILNTKMKTQLKIKIHQKEKQSNQNALKSESNIRWKEYSNTAVNPLRKAIGL